MAREQMTYHFEFPNLFGPHPDGLKPFAQNRYINWKEETAAPGQTFREDPNTSRWHLENMALQGYEHGWPFYLWASSTPAEFAQADVHFKDTAALDELLGNSKSASIYLRIKRLGLLVPSWLEVLGGLMPDLGEVGDRSLQDLVEVDGLSTMQVMPNVIAAGIGRTMLHRSAIIHPTQPVHRRIERFIDARPLEGLS